MKPCHPNEAFAREVERNIAGMREDTDLQAAGRLLLRSASPHKPAYNFRWMGRPIIQLPTDMVAMQEIIWQVRPDVIVECGVAHGGSILYYASILQLLGAGEVVGVDVDIRPHNRAAIEDHPMAARVRLIEGSSIDPATVARVRAIVGERRAIVVLDSNHTHDHVLAELRAYAPMVCMGGYCVVMDTLVEDMPDSFFDDRPWGVGNNPKTAVRQFLAEDGRFEVDRDTESKLLLTVAPEGYLRRVA